MKKGGKSKKPRLRDKKLRDKAVPGRVPRKHRATGAQPKGRTPLPMEAGSVFLSALATRLQQVLAAAKRAAATEEQLARATGADLHEIAAALAELEQAGAVVRMPRHRW